MKKLLAALALLALCFHSIAWSAENTLPTEDVNVEQTEDGVNPPSEEDETIEDEVTEDEDIDNEDENEPDRFIPTEQISQDLGVSFPVDI
ncbi:MAG: hypothetical protein COA96_07440 [SAR86 cluster bacterium]|uniref:Secreted protein n=1 Tax=SAR86 cluster bacterium TaxID=2030880 RepID=A0A2A5B1P9_9GAMM|nr:MAG: hypothetical protein COA96_07440 [SAR86 cluster bacterium]